MNSKLALLAIPVAAILGSVIFASLSSGQEGENIQLDLHDGIGLLLGGFYEQEQLKKDGLFLSGSYDITVRNSLGEIVSHQHKDNLVVDIGLQTIADQMFPNIDLNSSTQSQFSYIRIGTGTTPPAGGNTDIETPIGGCSAVQDTLVEGSFATNTATIVVDASFSGATCAATVQEAVLANAPTGGQILSRVLTGATVVGAGDTLDITYTFTIDDDGV